MTGSLLVLVLVDAALKGAVLVAIASVASRLLAKRSAASRHAVWTAAIAGQLLIPVLGVVLPSWSVPLIPAPWSVPAPVLVERAAAPVTNVAKQQAPPRAELPKAATPTQLNPAASLGQPASEVRSSFSRPDWLTDSRAVMAAIWMLGAIVVLMRLAIGTVRVGALARDGERVDDGRWLSLTQRVAKTLGVDRPLILLRGERLAVPVTWGVVYPAVLLPPEADEWPEERRRFVLVHELAHVKRFDALTQLVAQITLAVFWFNPLVWVAAHQMRVEREHACDDYVLRDGTPPSLYAGELLEMVRSIGTPSHESAAPAFAALAMARRSEFEGRMLAILDSRLDRKTINRRATIMTGAFIALLALPLAALRPFETESVAAEKSAATAIAQGTTAGAAAVTSAKKAATAVASGSLSCDRFTGSTGTSIQSHTDDNGVNVTQLVIITPEGATNNITRNKSGGYHCLAASMNGKIVFAPDEHSITSMEPGSFASFRERIPSSDRMVSASRGNGGTVQYTARLDGQDVPFDAGMQSWLAGFIPQMLREGGFNVPARVARIKAQGGVPAVLSEISRINTGTGKRAHYEALLATHLTDPEMESVLRRAGKDLGSSSTDLSAVIQQASRHGGMSKISPSEVGSALSMITSSTDKTTTMTLLAPTADRELLLTLAKAAESIESSTDRSNFLMTTAAHYLNRNDRELHQAYFHAAATLESSTDLSNVLMSAAPYGHASGDIVMMILEAVTAAESSTDRTNVLLTLASQRLITTAPQRNAYTKVAVALPSSTDKSNALAALLQSGQ